MSATDKILPTTQRALRAAILSTVAALALLPATGAQAQGLDRLFNRAAEVQNGDADQTEDTQDAADSWGLEVTGDTQEPSPLTLDSVDPEPAPVAATPAPADDNPVRDQLEQEIDARMRAIAERIGAPRPAAPEGTLTVEELDSLQREAQRASAAQNLQDTEYQAIRAEIEMLLYLQNTLAELQQARGQAPTAEAAPGGETAATEPAVDVEALRAQWEAEKAAETATQAQEQANASLAAEQASIPRLAAIKGAAGAWEAEIESVRGVLQFVQPGDALADGYIVESIDSKGAIIKAAASGNRYSLIPSPPAGPNAAPTGDLPMAQDLSQSGGVF